MIGLVVNPVAGVGGPAGLAGSDGVEVQRLAAARGARSRVHERTCAALAVIAAQHPGVVVATARGAMGADAVSAAGLEPQVVYAASPARDTEALDTSRAVAAVAAAGADLILVVGGDGTLRNAAAGLAASDTALPVRHATRAPAVLGVPAGVKMYSPVFAVSPRAAGAIAADWVTSGGLATDEREVLDIDEAAMRLARVDPTLYALLRVPYRRGRTQARKTATPASEQAGVQAAARGAVACMRPGIRYLLGPGSTTSEIAVQLGVEGTPLGVDVILDGEVIVRRASEEELLAEVARGPAQAVVTVIGGQGFLLGRGNQQLSASVLGALGDDPLLVVAPEQKLLDLRGRPLLVDTGDARIDARLAGHVRVITGVGTRSLYAVTAPELTSSAP